MNYFNQVLLHDFTPLSSPLVLCKIMIVIDEPSIEAVQQQQEDASDDSSDGEN